MRAFRLIGVLILSALIPIACVFASGLGAGGSGVGGMPANLTPKKINIDLSGGSTPSGAMFSLNYGTGGLRAGAYPAQEAWIANGSWGDGFAWHQEESLGESQIFYMGASGAVDGFTWYANNAVPIGTYVPIARMTLTRAGMLGLVNTLSSTKACATGFARTSPNYCQANSMPESYLVQNVWASAQVCTARSPTTVTLPADAKTVELSIDAASVANGIVSWKTNTVYFFTGATCAANTVAEKFFTKDKEIVAMTAGDLITYHNLRVRAPLVSANTFYTTANFLNTNGSVNYLGYDVLGYSD